MTPRTSDSSDVSSETVIDTVTATLVAGFDYRIVWDVTIRNASTSAAQWAILRLRTGTTTEGTEIAEHPTTVSARSGGGFGFQADRIEALFTAGSSGSQSFVGTLQGGGNVRISAAATRPKNLYVETVAVG